jgi:hypothetical protein
MLRDDTGAIRSQCVSVAGMAIAGEFSGDPGNLSEVRSSKSSSSRPRDLGSLCMIGSRQTVGARGEQVALGLTCRGKQAILRGLVGLDCPVTQDGERSRRHVRQDAGRQPPIGGPPRTTQLVAIEGLALRGVHVNTRSGMQSPWAVLPIRPDRDRGHAVRPSDVSRHCIRQGAHCRRLQCLVPGML